MSLHVLLQFVTKTWYGHSGDISKDSNQLIEGMYDYWQEVAVHATIAVDEISSAINGFLHRMKHNSSSKTKFAMGPWNA